MIKINNTQNCKILEPTPDELKAVILFLSRITLMDESRENPEIQNDPDMILEHYRMAEEHLIYVFKLEIETPTLVNPKQTFFHCSSSWDLSAPENIYPFVAFVNKVLILENGVLSIYEN